MNILNNPSLVEQLAASYALGTLRGGARRRFEALARGNAGVRAAALIWQSRLGSVAELQAQAAPSPAVWTRIQNLVNAEKQATAMRAARAAAEADAATTNAGGGWWSSLGLWRGASLAGVAAAVLAVVTGLNTNGQLNGQVRDLTAKLSAAPDIQYVAVLNDDKSAASMLVTFDPKNKRLLLKRVGGFQAQPDKSLQLWALPAGGAPKSLGVLGSDPVIRLTAASGDVREVPALAISLEPLGGAPAGSGPTGPVLLKGSLIETAQ
ncbi:MAG: RNA polymerase subunit sigma-70 [Polaromonas sp. 28-63-22]|nr:MAG: RNA polymerase subunit sigma-70 [Polaromonas sp. 28-63-22]